MQWHREGGALRRVRVRGAGAGERPARGDRRRARPGRALGRGAREEIGQSVANTSQHLQVLARAGLVRSRREGTRVFYRLASERVGELWAAVRDVAVRHVAEVNGARRRVPGRARRGRAAVADGAGGAAGARRGGRARRAPGARVPRGAHPRRALGPADRARALAPELPRRREIVAYCRGPYCVYADDAVRLLRARGLKARRLDVGFPEWRRAGLPVEKRAERRSRCCCDRS